MVGTFVAEGVRNARKHADPPAAAPTRVFFGSKTTACARLITMGVGLRLLALDSDQSGGSLSAIR